jgi:hypothetical protein
VAANDSVGGKDSDYIIHECNGGKSRDSIAETASPTAAQTYPQDNYAGYTFNKAFSVSDSTGAVTGYVAVIYFEDKPVGVAFDNEGAFLRVSEQRGFAEQEHHHH